MLIYVFANWIMYNELIRVYILGRLLSVVVYIRTVFMKEHVNIAKYCVFYTIYTCIVETYHSCWSGSSHIIYLIDILFAIKYMF